MIIEPHEQIVNKTLTINIKTYSKLDVPLSFEP